MALCYNSARLGHLLPTNLMCVSNGSDCTEQMDSFKCLEKFNPTTDLQTWQKLRLLVWVLLSYVKLAFDSVILK